ncbi:hypothetical protein PMAYCL1PPCAC_14319, partial [Pristionchus mayeri]
DEFSALDEEQKLLLAGIYPELEKKLQRSIERSKRKSFVISDGEDDKQIKKEVDDDDDSVQILENSGVVVDADRSKQSEDASFHSARSTLEPGERMFLWKWQCSTLQEQTGDEMDGSFVVNPRRFSYTSFDEIEADEQEPEGESLTEEDDRDRGDDEESVHSSDEDFIDDEEDEEEMSIDQSFRADVVMETPPGKRVMPQRSTRNQQFSTAGAIAPARGDNPAAISPRYASGKSIPKREEESDDGSGEESFERYLRKLREEDQKKKEEKEKVKEAESDEGEEMEDSFVVSDDSVDVINDEFENGSGDGVEEEESGRWASRSIFCSEDEDDDKENRRTKKTIEVPKEKPKKKNLLLELADTFNSPSVRAVDRDARDPDRHFLLSLSEHYEGKRRHADAESFLKRGVKGEKTRNALVARLFEIYNREVFGEKVR